MTEEDPRRLKQGGEAAPELVRALDALGRDRDAARLARVAEKLGPALADLPQPQAATTASGATKFLGLKTVITGLVVGAAMISFWAWESKQTPAEAPPTQEMPSATPPAVARGEPPGPPPAAAPAHPELPDPAAPSSSASPESPRRAARPRPGSAAPSPGPTSRAETEAPGAPSAPSDRGERSAAAVATPANGPAPDERERPVEPPPKEAPRVRSEVELLFEARKAMSSQPMAALSLIDEHAGRYPRGQLAPEREVLRIEALRKLGRSAEADRRLREFQSRYPKSIHLRRLEGAAGSTLAP